MFVLWLFACQNESNIEPACPEEEIEEEVIVEETEPEPEPEEPETSIWDGAQLNIVEPLPSQLIPIASNQNFSAEIINPQGDLLDFPNIAWSSDLDPTWIQSGSSFSDDTLIPGNHTLRAEAILPNGNRLVYAIGGIRVQHPFAGTYTGTTTIDATVNDWEGNETTVSCAGAATLTVNLEGTQALGDSACLLQLFGQNLETTYDFEIDILENTLSGLAIADFVIAQRDFPLEGSIDETQLQATWADMVYGSVMVEGALSLQKVSD